MAHMYRGHLFSRRSISDNRDGMQPPLMVSQSSPHFLNPVTVILLILFGVLPISAGAQQLTCSPTPVQFRDTVIGQSESLPVVLTNTGSTNVTVSEVNSGLAAFRVSSLKLPSTLGPGRASRLAWPSLPRRLGGRAR